MMLPLVLLLAVGPDYQRDIKPIFERRCVGCHSATATMGSLNLETWQGMMQGGNNGAVVTPGKARESTLYLSLIGQTPAIGRMPFSNEPMPEEEIALIGEWIDAGAAAQETQPSTRPPSQLYTLAWRPDGRVIATGAYGEVRLVDAGTQLTVETWKGHADAVRGLAWSTDGKRLAAAGGVPGRKGEVKIWQDNGQLLTTITGHADCIYAVAFSPDGALVATASYDKLIKLWDAATGKEVRTLKDHIDAIYALEFTPDGKRLVSGSADRSVKVWDVASGERLYTLGEPTDGVNTVAVSPDGKRVAAGGQDKTVRVWRLEEKGAVLEAAMIAHEDAVLKVVWTRDGRHVLSSAADRTLKLFRAADLRELKSLRGQRDWAFGLGYSPDGERVAVGRMDGSLEVLEIKP